MLGGDEEVGFALVTLLAFLRIATHPAAFPRPLPAPKAISIVTNWIDQPSVRIAEPTERHWTVVESLCSAGQARGPLLMDAHLAALTIEHGATLCTTDRDFARFPGLRFEDPLA